MVSNSHTQLNPIQFKNSQGLTLTVPHGVPNVRVLPLQTCVMNFIPKPPESSIESSPTYGQVTNKNTSRLVAKKKSIQTILATTWANSYVHHSSRDFCEKQWSETCEKNPNS